jgi:fructose/tagatose bisphosphate aldolase
MSTHDTSKGKVLMARRRLPLLMRLPVLLHLDHYPSLLLVCLVCGIGIGVAPDLAGLRGFDQALGKGANALTLSKTVAQVLMARRRLPLLMRLPVLLHLDHYPSLLLVCLVLQTTQLSCYIASTKSPSTDKILGFDNSSMNVNP